MVGDQVGAIAIVTQEGTRKRALWSFIDQNNQRHIERDLDNDPFVNWTTAGLESIEAEQGIGYYERTLTGEDLPIDENALDRFGALRGERFVLLAKRAYFESSGETTNHPTRVTVIVLCKGSRQRPVHRTHCVVVCCSPYRASSNLCGRGQPALCSDYAGRQADPREEFGFRF